MILTTHSRQDANSLVSKLDKATPKSIGIVEPSSQQSEQPEHHHKLPNLSARLVKDISRDEIRKQKCRLIIRNLSFQAIEDNILQKFRKFGPITEVSIPRIAVATPKSTKGRSTKKADQQTTAEKLKPRGFGFVTFLCENDAQSAVNGGCDGMKICNREFAVDFCLNRHAHEWELKRSEDEKIEEHKEENQCPVEENSVEESEDENDAQEQENEDVSEDSAEIDDEDADNDDLEGSGGNDSDLQSAEDEETKGDDGAPETSQSHQEELRDVSEGRTIFIR